jgi:hypothetical protein
MLPRTFWSTLMTTLFSTPSYRKEQQMQRSKLGAICLATMVGLAMIVVSLALLGVSPAQAQGIPANASPTTAANVTKPNPERDPTRISYQIWLTDPLYFSFTSPEQEAEVFDRNGNQLGMGTFKAETRDDEPALIGSLSLSLPASASFELTIDQTEEILFDAEQNPVGVVLRGQGTKTRNGHVTNFEATHIVQYLPNGQCCLVEIFADALNSSGGMRFQVDGSLRFE